MNDPAGIANIAARPAVIAGDTIAGDTIAGDTIAGDTAVAIEEA